MILFVLVWFWSLPEVDATALTLISFRSLVSIVIVVMNQPTAYYLVSSVMTCVGCMAILGPMFGPKFAQRNKKEPRGRMASSVVIRGKPTGISGLDNSGASSAWHSRNRSGGFRPGSGFSSTHEGPGSSKGVHSGTFHHTRRHSDDELSPFGSTMKRQSLTEHVQRTKPLTTYAEDDDLSTSFHAG